MLVEKNPILHQFFILLNKKTQKMFFFKITISFRKLMKASFKKAGVGVP